MSSATWMEGLGVLTIWVLGVGFGVFIDSSRPLAQKRFGVQGKPLAPTTSCAISACELHARPPSQYLGFWVGRPTLDWLLRAAQDLSIGECFAEQCIFHGPSLSSEEDMNLCFCDGPLLCLTQLFPGSPIPLN